jgi:hypothetical protein
MTTTTETLANVPLPAGAVRVDDWYDTGTAEPGRYFVGSSWVVERNNHHNRDTDIMILVDGTQYCDGRVERIISVDDDDLTISQARELAAALVAAADEAEQMASYDSLVTAR